MSTQAGTRAAETVRVDDDAGRRLDNFLLGRLKGVPRARVYRMLRRGEVRVNGGRRAPSYRLRRGDEVRLPPHRGAVPTAGKAPVALGRALDAAVIHEDENLLVLDKPSGWAVHGGSGVSFGVIETLRQRDSTDAYELAHRLDRDTSGCLAVAKNRRALLSLHAQFRTGRVGKRYDLIVHGHWPARLRRVDRSLRRYVVASGERRVRVAEDGEPARTDFALARLLGDADTAATWLLARPKTGRTHQIRVHAAVSGHPVVGDDKYGRDAATSQRPRLMLHATELVLEVDGRVRAFTAPVPSAFVDFADRRPVVGEDPKP